MTKVVLNPKHFHVRAKADDGTIWLTHEKHLLPVVPIKDVTSEVLLCLCADLSAGGETQRVERSVKFSDGFTCRVTVEVVEEGAQWNRRAATTRNAELEAERDALRGVLALLISDVDMAAHDLNSGLLDEPLRIARAALAATSGGE